jgi:tetratricopeptide (TPR) repeat protein
MTHNSRFRSPSFFTPQRSRLREVLTFWTIAPNEHRIGKGRTLAMAFGLLALAVGVFVVALLPQLPAVASAEASTGEGAEWLRNSAPFALLSTATPIPTPTPTLTPSQIAAQFEPQLQTAISVKNWDRALEIVAIMSGVDPSGEQVQNWAYTTAVQYGRALVAGGRVDEAQTQFDQAVTLAPDDAEARRWQETTQMYRTGREAAEAGAWQAALESFTFAEERMPDYGDLYSRLVEAYRRQGEAAIAVENWRLAIESLTHLRRRTPGDPSVLALLSQAYIGQAQAAMKAGDYPAAIDTMLEARERLPEAQNLIEPLSLAYRGQGQAAMAQQNWTRAVETLSQAHEQLPNDQDIIKSLALAYRQRGTALHETAVRNTKKMDMDKLRQSRADLQEATALQPDDASAQAHLKKVENLLFPYKRIEVDISEQRLYAWEGDNLVYKFPVSTGLRGQDTATGRFQILDKIPMAYSRIWKLRMPNWMGIYYVKGIENGFHGLPYRPDGTKMWAGLLGQRASYGCIVLGSKQSKMLYDWAEVGTRVDIHR